MLIFNKHIIVQILQIFLQIAQTILSNIGIIVNENVDDLVKKGQRLSLTTYKPNLQLAKSILKKTVKKKQLAKNQVENKTSTNINTGWEHSIKKFALLYSALTLAVIGFSSFTKDQHLHFRRV